METVFLRWLETVVRRNRFRLTVQVLLLSAAVVTGCVVLARLQLSQHWPSGLLSAGGAALAIGSAIAIWAGRVQGGYTLASAARHYDEQLGLQHRLTSALELKRSGSQEGLLSAALLDDANKHVQGLAPAPLAPVADRYTAGAALAVLLIALGLFLWPAHTPPGSAPTETVADVETSPPNVTFEDIQAAARQLAVDASMQDVDALLSAATGLNALVRDAAQGLTQEQINERFAELMELARMGYGDNPPSWLYSNPSPTQSLASLIEEYQERLRQQSRASTAPTPPSSSEASTNDVADMQGAGSLTGAPDAQATAPVAGPTLPGTPTDDKEPGAEMAQGAPVGASTQSGTGGGDMAGAGSQPLQAAAPVVAENRAGTEMLLESEEYDTGSRIRIDMTLAPAPSEGLEASGGAERLSDGLTANSLQNDREFLQFGDRLAAARYFTPAVAGEGSTRR